MAWKGIREQIYLRQHGRCFECGSPLKKWVVHHLINRRDGGKETPDNGVGRCQRCEIMMHRIYKDGNRPGVVSQLSGIYARQQQTRTGYGSGSP